MLRLNDEGVPARTAQSGRDSSLRIPANRWRLVALLAVTQTVGYGVLYEAAFPVVVSWFAPANRARALLAVTVVAGFASSIFLPLAGWLNDACGWRDAITILAIGHGALTILLHVLVRRPPKRAAGATVAAPDRADIIRRALRDGVFWLLGAAFVAQTCAVSAISVLLVTMLRSLGHSSGFAATTAGLLGVLSVTGRLATTAVPLAQHQLDHGFGRRRSVLRARSGRSGGGGPSRPDPAPRRSRDLAEGGINRCFTWPFACVH